MEDKIATPEEKTIPVLIIADWDKSFENAKSRKVDHKSYGQYIMKQGRGYCRMMAEKDGASIYGTFIALTAIIQAKPSLTRNGYITETGDETGYPLSFEDISAISRIPLKTIKRALTVLSSRAVGWIYADTMRIPLGYAEDTTVSAQYTGIVCTVCTVGSIRPKEPLVKSQGQTQYQPDFLTFWKTYPKKKKKFDAFKAWKQMEADRPSIEIIIKKVQALKQTNDWKKDNGQYIPYPASWLRSGGWDDETEVSPSQPQRPANYIG